MSRTLTIPTTPPIGAVIARLGNAVAVAQRALDDNSIETAKTMGGLTGDASAFTDSAGRRYNMLELGFEPTFYQFTEARMQVRMAVSTSFSEESESATSKARMTLGRGGLGMKAVNAEYASRFQYQAESSSQIDTKIVARPTPAALDKRLRIMLAQQGRQ